jgi:hypothetical protein
VSSLLLHCGIVSVLLLGAEIQWGFPAEEQGLRDDLVTIRGSIITEEGKPVANFPVRCRDSQPEIVRQEIVREVLTDKDGTFTLTRLPSHIRTIDCEVGDDRLYAKAQKKIPVTPDTEVAFTLKFQTRIGEGVWKKLAEEGISTVWDLAPLTAARIQVLSQKHEIDPTVLTKYTDEAKKLLDIP